MNAKGVNGTVSIAADGVIKITRSGFAAKASHPGKSGVDISITDVVRVEMKQANAAQNGWIYFETEADKNSGKPFDWFYNDNSVVFTFFKSKEFEAIRAHVDSVILNRGARASESNVTNVADEIKKLADLRDQGILTETEFSDQKKKLLS